MTHVILPQTFNCEHFDNGEVLLKTDYGIDCESDTHKSFRTFAGLMILFYPIGVPAFFLAMVSIGASISFFRLTFYIRCGRTATNSATRLLVSPLTPRANGCLSSATVSHNALKLKV